MKAAVKIFLVTVLLIVLWGVWEGVHFLFSGASREDSTDIIFEVKPKEGFQGVAQRLYENGLVTSLFYLKILGKLSGERSIKVGEYLVRKTMRPGEILEILSSGHSLERQVTFPEGRNIYEMAKIVEEKGIAPQSEFLKLVHDPHLIESLLGENLPSLEGYLFPETYKYTKYTSLEKIIRHMVQNFLTTYQSLLHLRGGQHEIAGERTRHQNVILASVIEKETGASDERPLISSVFSNRLRLGMRLQSDPTILYGIWVKTGEFKQNITREDILRKTPYNTYTIEGLPFGPIANPGREALRAALRPAHSSYLFFVSRNDGTHEFSESLEQHNRAVGRFQLQPSARQGKSWRDLRQRGHGDRGGP